MRLYHYSILFMILFLGIASVLYVQEQTVSRREKERQRMERSVDLAADAAAGYLATYSDGRLRVEKEEVLEVFFCNLFAALGVLDRVYEQERLKECVACLLIVDVDGYYLWHKNGGRGEATCFVWEEKVFFTDEESRGKMLEEAVLFAIRQQEEARGLPGGAYRLELPEGEGMLRREMGEYGVLVMLRGIPEKGYQKAYEHFAFSGAALYKINP